MHRKGVEEREREYVHINSSSLRHWRCFKKRNAVIQNSKLACNNFLCMLTRADKRSFEVSAKSLWKVFLSLPLLPLIYNFFQKHYASVCTGNKRFSFCLFVSDKRIYFSSSSSLLTIYFYCSKKNYLNTKWS